MGLRSRRQFRFESDTPEFVGNLNTLAGTSIETAPHDDTVAGYLERLPVEECERLPGMIVDRLVRMKALDGWRLYGKFLIAIDGTGQLVFHKRHCPRCLTRKAANGETIYYHHVLEAKLVTDNGFAFSIATEFIENSDPKATKQDCELKAFVRLADKLKANFPRLPICLLADSLYPCAPVFDVCKAKKWDFIFTFKSGAMPAVFAEFECLRDLAPDNRTDHSNGSVHQRFAWVNDLAAGGHRLNVFECRETTPKEEKYFAWITNIKVGCASIVTLANRGGRQRWKIENEGFNIQKNHGYELEHAYSEHEHAAKNFYLLLQVAHAINQLMLKGSLLKDFKRNLGSIRNFLRRLAEAFRNCLIATEFDNPLDLPPIQIRFDSS